MAHRNHHRIKRLGLFFGLALFLTMPFVASGDGTGAGTGIAKWEQVLAAKLPLYGHRNWIVIADSAYPAQARDGIETISTGADQLTVVKAVLAALDGTQHVKPIIYTDAELKFVPEQDAPGISAYREGLAKVLGQRPVNVMPHEQVIAELDKAAQTFRVLILKTNLTVPYTSVFLRLDCGYWSPEAEQRLRAAMEAGKKPTP